jgi:hypothetical protein
VSAPDRLHPDDLSALAAALADLVAERVVARLAEDRRPDEEERLLTAAEVARRFRVSPEWVRENAERLGALQLGDGPRPRLRFDPERVVDALSARPLRGRSDAPDRPAERVSRRRRSRRSGKRTGLLPVFEVDSAPKSEKAAGRRANAPGPATRDEASSRTEPTRQGPRSAARARGSRVGTDERSRNG